MTNMPNTLTKDGQIEASRMLAIAMGWQPIPETKYFIVESTPDGKTHYFLGNLYDSDNIILAWSVLTWATNYNKALSEEARTNLWIKYRSSSGLFSTFVREMMDINYLMQTSANIAQKTWLDKILRLAINAGIIKGEIGDEQ